ncbi:MAG: acyl carrier protein [Lachnospiraceae bacterium]|nr:acyl carrier protein [Lachnospiraceae bacterium]MBP3508059.1 acyl carrier protein [Lachnospiraceae bacterium]
MDKETIKKQSLEVIEEVLPELDVATVDTSASITDDYDVNSVSIIKLLVGLEDKFNVAFDDSELALNKYSSFDDVIESVEKKMN